MIQRKLIAGNGMYTAEQFNALGLVAKQSWLNSLTHVEVRGQASVIAAAGRRTVEEVLRAWVQTGIISNEDATAALSAEGNR